MSKFILAFCSTIGKSSFLKDVDRCALRNSLLNLDNVYNNFFNGSEYLKFKIKEVCE